MREPEDPPIPRRARYGGAAVLARALLVWLALPFGHPAYAVFIPPSSPGASGKEVVDAEPLSGYDHVYVDDRSGTGSS
ncbi:MAG: hypothetical protein DMF82_15565 [Acidobacteria bacterium]|nr:MAG: hypothetical protein DMF82_15565 [Acidobacteriota bacterium]